MQTPSLRPAQRMLLRNAIPIAMFRIPVLYLVLACIAAYLLFGAVWFTVKWVAKGILFLFLVLFILSLFRGKKA